ncbi:ABC transporter substrate-binding protein [Desulfolutivibrio sulfoxidireducens]|nr:ABC transporter substrate-binding protein [Desulfolutivibrio sulfoxidireducens]
MGEVMSRRGTMPQALAILMCFILHGSDVFADATGIRFRISLENTPAHIQSQSVKRFALLLSEKAGNRLNVEYYDSASLFRDTDVFSALTEGKVEMAVPGIWHVASFVPDVNIFLLPAFYGRDARENHAVLESDAGKELDARIEDSLGVKVPGKWFDLGYANLYTVKHKLLSLGDIDGLKIRVAGGVANEMRIEAAGARATSIPWPDFPIWLDRGEVDGVLTTHETVRSAELWTHGLRYCLEDRQYFPMYVPMISERVWKILPEDIQRAILEAWEETAAWERDMAAKAQLEARNDLEAHGVEIVVPQRSEILKWRERLGHSQDAIITRVGLDKEFALRAVRSLENQAP